MLCASKDKPTISIREDPKEGIKVGDMFLENECTYHVFLKLIVFRKINPIKLYPWLVIYLVELSYYILRYNGLSASVLI